MKPVWFIRKFFEATVLTSIIYVFAFQWAACSKEYSREAVPITPKDTTPAIIPPAPELPACNVCSAYSQPLNLNQWSLKAEQSQACGIVDTAIINLERNAFTFFGPSACSSDTGMVITVYLNNERLDRDRINLTVDRIAFYYYDRVGPSYIYMNSPASGFVVQIENYNHQSRIASGTFTGNVQRTDGNSRGVLISSGKFKVKLL